MRSSVPSNKSPNRVTTWSVAICDATACTASDTENATDTSTASKSASQSSSAVAIYTFAAGTRGSISTNCISTSEVIGTKSVSP